MAQVLTNMAFNALDVNGDGVISQQEFMNALQQPAPQVMTYGAPPMYPSQPLISEQTATYLPTTYNSTVVNPGSITYGAPSLAMTYGAPLSYPAPAYTSSVAMPPVYTTLSTPTYGAPVSYTSVSPEIMYAAPPVEIVAAEPIAPAPKKDSFDRIDVDGKGYITREDWAAMVVEGGDAGTHQVFPTAKSMITYANPDGAQAAKSLKSRKTKSRCCS
eukprot:NODE_15928_length_1021_cov_8.947427.p1 GENE.NODE_15928_length_1021_cov_8.947427~~NODE_15928_length_1021_cov_8.947427.p1  ORF type:complete len:216 (+),score=55.36 NODE_15928_length_1021_cov_8.947427:95-742(+)